MTLRWQSTVTNSYCQDEPIASNTEGATLGRPGFSVGWRRAKRDEAATMFGQLKTFISSFVKDARLLNQFENKDCRLATGALLIRVATVDGELSAARQEMLHAVLKSSFELDDHATVQLINDAVVADRNAVDLYHFTRQLNDAFDDEGRRRIVKMMWEIILVDGSANEFENNIIWRAADLLGVPSRQRIEFRQRIAASRAALAG